MWTPTYNGTYSLCLPVEVSTAERTTSCIIRDPKVLEMVFSAVAEADAVDEILHHIIAGAVKVQYVNNSPGDMTYIYIS